MNPLTDMPRHETTDFLYKLFLYFALTFAIAFSAGYYFGVADTTQHTLTQLEETK